MKKIISAILVLCILSLLPITAFATEINGSGEPKSQDTNLTLSISPTYVVTIPADAKIDFNATSTDLGIIKATKIQIEPNKMVVVSANAGELQNKTDAKKSLDYKLMNGQEKFSSIAFTDTEKQADLKIAITQSDWNKAYAGDYEGKITFTISYENNNA